MIAKHLIFLALIPCGTPQAAQAAESSDRLQPLPVSNVEIHDRFWAPKIKVYREQTIPHSWQFLAWELRSLRRAGGQTVDGELNNTWGEANLYKFMETAAYALAMKRDAELERRLDEVIALLRAAQRPDGYLHAYVTNNKKIPWDPEFLDGSHDGYVLGHLIEAALAHHAATQNRSLLDIACRAADEACNHFLGPNARPGFCGHAGLEMALVELYRQTRQPRYLELAQAFVDWRGRGKVKPVSATPRAYFQDAIPLCAQRTLEGHAVRAVFFATGVVDLALETGQMEYRLAANRFWDSTTLRRMTVTGNVGPRKEHEAFGEDYELPNDGYYESCAACGLVKFAQSMFLLERRSQSCDVLERVLYNAILHGISLDGTNSYYCNPLSDRDHPRDNCWVCCPPNLSRTLMQVGHYAYAATGHDLYVNLFVGGSARVGLKSGEVVLRVETDYPWDGQVKMRVEAGSPRRFALRVRKPGWCDRAAWKLNGEPLRTDADYSGYWVFERSWRSGDLLSVTLEMPLRRMVAHPNVMSCRDNAAIQRGPIVYGFEGLDNKEFPVALAADCGLRAEHRPNLLGGVTVIHGIGANGRPVLAIPFYSLANRGKSWQEVWVKQQGLKPSSDWWLGALYRPLTDK
jgi:uncharacterized protein